MKGFESGHGKSPNRFYLAIIFSNSALGLGGSGATAGRRYMSGPVRVWVWGWFDFKAENVAIPANPKISYPR